MNPFVTTGDITLAARPATPETFAPYGRLVRPGGSVALGSRARVLLSLTEARSGPRRVTHLVRYPEARRAVIAPGESPLWVVVLGPGTESTARPEAFSIQPGAAVVIAAGVWHAGPQVVTDTTVAELIEARGGADRLDRVALRDLLGAEAVRVILPERPGAPA